MPSYMPSISSILITIITAILGNVAVIAVIAFVGRGFINHIFGTRLETFKSDLKKEGDEELERVKGVLSRDLESYKVKLKKSEFLFEKEFQAASEFLKLYSLFMPTRSHPEMDWGDAMEVIADDAGRTEIMLSKFVVEHGAALDEGDRDRLEAAVALANDLGLELGSYSFEQRNEKAEILHTKIKQLRDNLMQRVRDQSSV
jgi:hypothetical protein